MAIPESPIPPGQFSSLATQLIDAMRQQTVATLTAAIMSASKQPYSIEQMLELRRDIHFAIFPTPSHGAYQQWAETKDDRLKKVHVATP
jgi:hypothetical protein